MVRQSLRDLAGAFPLFTILGSVAVCAAGLASFDAALAYVYGDFRAPTAAEQRAAERRAAAARESRKVLQTVPAGTVRDAAAERRRNRPTDTVTESPRPDQCGDRVVAVSEQCDDGNVISGDGCSSACGIEYGYVCEGTTSVCAAICGDGIIATGTETCDDGNLFDGDGCSRCIVDAGYTCGGMPSVCGSNQ